MALQVHGSLTKTGFAYLSLRELIITGELTPGTAIQQGDLAKKMGVSTTPLREAIRRLSAEGLISLSAHKDARVTEVTADEARHLLEVRDQLDPLAAGLAAARRTEDELTRILQASSQLQPLSEGVYLPALMDHREFHRVVQGGILLRQRRHKEIQHSQSRCGQRFALHPPQPAQRFRHQ